MSEKMLVTQALDERDLLVKKIGDKIVFYELMSVQDQTIINCNMAVDNSEAGMETC